MKNIANNMMSEFSFDNRASDWDLQAIVKGTSLVNNTNTMNNSLPSSYDDPWFECLEYHDFTNTKLVFNDPLTQGSSPQNITQTCTADQNAADDSCAKTRAASISRRRKNKHKIIKMVQQEGGDRVLSDKWNWRKYGEKVIKGSPYPRSYYRCSYQGQGGCSARKQVEQSSNDSSLFLITYMEEHTHPYPTKRHSQAGRSAKRFNHSSSTKIVITNESQTTLVTSESSSTNINVRDLALRGDKEDVGSMVCVAEDHQGGVCFGNRVMFEDDSFAGLDYLEGLLCMNVCN